MGPDRQLEQLCSVYAERSDAELIALHENCDDLTEVAQQALAQVMQERKLNLHGNAVAEAAENRDLTRYPGPLTGDEVEAANFYDAFQAAEAIRHMERAEVPHRMVDWNALSDGDGSPQRVSLGLIVSQRDVSRTRQLLQNTMKLFPVAEGTDEFNPLQEFATVSLGRFEREGALRIAGALGSNGVSYIWTDGREDGESESDFVMIEVNGIRIEYARQLAEQALAQGDA